MTPVGYEAVIGLETHIQLNTETKIFCSCRADSWNAPPNTNICPVCTGLPGALPVLNQAAVEKALCLAVALQAEVQPVSHFDRKNYFYPDLPKGYQISQYDRPLARNGFLNLPLPGGQVRWIAIAKLHIEEDAGKTRLAGGRRLIDFNRCGVPLVELVTGPDLRSGEEAARFLTALRQLLRWLGLSEASPEKGHLRCDVNVSIRPAGSEELNPKTEIKNLNSIAAVREAVQHEIERQARARQAGQPVEPWTLEWDEDAGRLRKMRAKETEADYRYFREPDLLPLAVEPGWLARVRAGLPELPRERSRRFREQFGLSEYSAGLLTEERSVADYFEGVLRVYGGDPQRAANWVVNDVLRLMNQRGVPANELHLTPVRLVEILNAIDSGRMQAGAGKLLLDKVEALDEEPGEIARREGLDRGVGREALEALCAAAIAAHPQEVQAYRDGKLALLGWFTGQVMHASGRQGDPALVQEILARLLAPAPVAPGSR